MAPRQKKSLKSSPPKGPAGESTNQQSKPVSTAIKPGPKSHAGAFPIVGIGASAGGLQALEDFFTHMPSDSGLAFVIVTHLDPQHASFLPEILQKKTRMPVRQVEADNLQVRPNHVYIIPPNHSLSIKDGRLKLLPLSKSPGSVMPIDGFFRSLALDQGDLAVGIVLSGTGSDGTLGLKAIKGEAGLAMTQDPDSAQYDGMPRSAMATGLADFVLSPEQLPKALLDFTQHQVSLPKTSVNAGGEKIKEPLQKIYALLRDTTQHDFSNYKQNTFIRRIERRMHVHQIDDIAGYMHYLEESSREASILFKELLIGVTNFFRDPTAFETLKNDYLYNLLKEKPKGADLRIWVPGCSSGEEVYSLAIIAQECLETLRLNVNVQIFGSDLDVDAIDKARAGRYLESISADVNPDRLKKFFNKKDGFYQIKKAIRDMVIFAPHNIIKDPPFSKLDLISCRNLLIYFDVNLQRKLLPIFHHSLKPNGLLFLGTSESIGSATDLFELRDKKWKIFTRKTAPGLGLPGFVFPVTKPTGTLPREDIMTPMSSPEIDTLQLVSSMLAQANLPPCVVINDQADIVYFHGHTGRYLEAPEGRSSFNLVAMARAGLKAELIGALREMATGQQDVVVKNLQVKENDHIYQINLTVRPLDDQQKGLNGYLLVLFEEVPATDKKSSKKPPSKNQKKKPTEVAQLENELQRTRENLRASIEELEASNQELRSTNEELQSTNEELQSTNEELETSKEELQSLNEESTTVNNELQSRVEDLSTANDDMKNLLDATNIATIFLDIELGVRRFTPKVTELIPLTSSDIGRPLDHFSSELKDADLTGYAKQVLDHLNMQEFEGEGRHGNYYRVRLRPYRTLNNLIDGVVITFEDITELKQISYERRLAAVVKDSYDAITLQDTQGRIKAWNRGAERLFGYTEAEALQLNASALVPAQHAAKISAALAHLKTSKLEPFTTERVHKDGQLVPVCLTMTKLPDDDGEQALIATTEMSLAKLSEMALRKTAGGEDGRG